MYSTACTTVWSIFSTAVVQYIQFVHTVLLWVSKHSTTILYTYCTILNVSLTAECSVTYERYFLVKKHTFCLETPVIFCTLHVQRKA
jgi:hypothetical protein